MKALLLVVLVSLCGGCANSILRGNANVVEVACDGSWIGERVCKGILKARSRLSFAINPLTNSVSFTVEKNEGDWYSESALYKDCAIVDSDNWECTTGTNEKTGMFDGQYRRRGEGTFSYDVHGVSGWRYWAARVGITELAFLRMKVAPAS